MNLADGDLFNDTAYFVNMNANPLNQNIGKQKKKNYGKITEISAPLTFLTLPMEQR
jgi:hypothetical protein